MTPSGIEAVTFRLVAQYLNQLHHRVPHKYTRVGQKISGEKFLSRIFNEDKEIWLVLITIACEFLGIHTILVKETAVFRTISERGIVHM
jgi:hypothetical protein